MSNQRISANFTVTLIVLTCGYLSNAEAASVLDVNYQLGRDYPLSINSWLPIDKSEKRLFFTNVFATYSRTAGSFGISPGIIYRQLNKHASYGYYLYGAFNRSPEHQSFWTANPGIEYLTPIWHLNLNGYVPLNNKTQKYGEVKFANEFGDYNYTSFSGHTHYDRLARRADVTGFGTDVIATYNNLPLENKTTLSLGLYYFNLDTKLLGLSASITSLFNSYISGNITYTHDNQRAGTLSIGLSLHTDSGANNWASSPVQHNIASLGTANTIPINDAIVPISGKEVFRNNVWFFQPGGIPLHHGATLTGECTFENPCGNFTSSTPQELSLMTTGANIYLKPGEYTLNSTTSIYDKQSIYGRSNDYVRPAEEDDRALLYANQISLNNTNDNTFSHIRLKNNGSSDPAFIFEDANNISLDNVMIGVNDQSNTANNYFLGIDIINSDNVTIKGSEIYANNYNTTIYTVSGIQLSNATNITIRNSQINTNTIGSNNLGASGLFAATGTSSANVFNSTFTGTNNGATTAKTYSISTDTSSNLNLFIGGGTFTLNNTGNSSGLSNFKLSNNSTATIKNATLSASNNTTQTNDGVFNILIDGDVTLDIYDSTVTGNASSAEGKGAAVNFQASGNSRLNIYDTNAESTATSKLVTGNTNISTFNNAVVTVNNSTLNTEMAGGEAAEGVEPSGAVSIWTNDNSKITINYSTITATAGNKFTGPVAVQVQDSSEATIYGSILTTHQPFGNSTHVYSAAIALSSHGVANITNSTINMHAKGLSNLALPMISAFDTSTLTLKNSTLTLTNSQRTTAGYPTISTGILASSTANLNLLGNTFSLNGVTSDSSIVRG